MRIGTRRKKGIALIIALFAIFAVLVMGVTYIGVSFTNSQASKGLEKEAMAVAFANAGVEYAMNYMATPANWSSQLAISDQSDYIPPGYDATFPHVKVYTLPQQDPDDASKPFEMWQTGYTSGWHGQYGKVIDTIANLKTLNISTNGNNSVLYGHWRILVLPEAEGVVNVSGETAFAFNTNFRVIVRARLLNTPTPPADLSRATVASREVMARLSNEFPGSIYQNVRSYDAAGGFAYPNYEECTADAVFVAEDFKWDGGIRIDGADPVNQWGRPQSSTIQDFDPTSAKVQPLAMGVQGGPSGWVNDTSDFSGSLNIDTLADLALGNKDRWPQFNGKVLAQKSGVTQSNNPALNSGINLESADMLNNKNQIFKNAKDPYQTGVPTMNISESIWKTTAGTDKMGTINVDTSGNVTTADGFFKALAEEGGTGGGKWFIDVPDSDLKPDAYTGYEKPAAPTYRMTMTPLSGTDAGKTRFFVEKMVRDQSNGATGGEMVRDGGVMSFDSSNTDWKQVIYCRGGNVQVVGGDPGNTSSPEPGNGTAGNGNLTVPCTVIADTNPRREAEMYRASITRGVAGRYDGSLSTCNVWDAANNRYLYRCYDSSGNVTAATANAQYAKPIWEATDAEKGQWETGGKIYRFPPQRPNINEQPEGNLSVIGDTTYKKGMESPSLGLLAKNHVFLNDLKHVEKTYAGADKNERATLDLNATIGSKNHSMQMDFFNFNHNGYGKNHISAGNLNAPPPGKSLLTQVPCADGDITINNMRFTNKWARMPVQARKQLWWDYYFGAEQPEGDTGNYGTMYQGGMFKFNGSIISRFADVEADAGDPSTNAPGMGYTRQQLSYDTNLKNRSAPFFSTACYDKTKALTALFWSVLSFVDRGAISETRQNL
jgi:hypothetical protein